MLYGGCPCHVYGERIRIRVGGEGGLRGGEDRGGIVGEVEIEGGKGREEGGEKETIVRREGEEEGRGEEDLCERMIGGEVEAVSCSLVPANCEATIESGENRPIKKKWQ